MFAKFGISPEDYLHSSAGFIIKEYKEFLQVANIMQMMDIDPSYLSTRGSPLRDRLERRLIKNYLNPFAGNY